MDNDNRITCDCCGNKTAVLTNTMLVFGEELNDWPLIWYCRPCMAVVYCHPNTNIPMGRLANKQTRKLRKRAHLVFDKLWQSKLIKRDDAYLVLSKRLNVPFEDCHIAMLSDDDLKRVIELAPEINSVVNPFLKQQCELKNADKKRIIRERELHKKQAEFKRTRKKRNRRKR